MAFTFFVGMVSSYIVDVSCNYCGVLGCLLVVVFFAPIWGASQGSVPSVACFTALYGSTSLQQSSEGSCNIHKSGHNLRADCRVLPFANGANAAPVSVPALSAVQALMLAVVALKQPAIEC